MKRERGFSIIELMVAMAITSVVAYFASSGILTLFSALNVTEAKDEAANWSRIINRKVTTYFETRDLTGGGFDLKENSGNQYRRIEITRVLSSGVEVMSVYSQCMEHPDAPKDFEASFCGLTCPRGQSIQTIIKTAIGESINSQSFPNENNSGKNLPLGVAACIVDRGGDSVSFRLRSYILLKDSKVINQDTDVLLMLRTLAHISAGMLPNEK